MNAGAPPQTVPINAIGLAGSVFLAIFCLVLAGFLRRGARLPGGWGRDPAADRPETRRFLATFLVVMALVLLAAPWIIQFLPWRWAAILLAIAGAAGIAAAGWGVARHGSPDEALTRPGDVEDNSRS